MPLTELLIGGLASSVAFFLGQWLKDRRSNGQDDSIRALTLTIASLTSTVANLKEVVEGLKDEVVEFRSLREQVTMHEYRLQIIEKHVSPQTR
jgi:hypothetical protein